MTCIVGLEHSGKVYIGADSASVGNWNIQKTRLPKVFKRDNFLIGYTSSFRMGQILQYQLIVRERKEFEEDSAYMVCAFIESVRTCLKDGGFAKVENTVEEGGTFLVGYKGKLYQICGDFQVNSSRDGFDAVGSGASYALGVMRVLKDLPPQEQIREALETAAYFDRNVCEPFTILEI